MSNWTRIMTGWVTALPGIIALAASASAQTVVVEKHFESTSFEVISKSIVENTVDIPLEDQRILGKELIGFVVQYKVLHRIKGTIACKTRSTETCGFRNISKAQISLARLDHLDHQVFSLRKHIPGSMTRTLDGQDIDVAPRADFGTKAVTTGTYEITLYPALKVIADEQVLRIRMRSILYSDQVGKPLHIKAGDFSLSGTITLTYTFQNNNLRQKPALTLGTGFGGNTCGRGGCIGGIID